MSSSYTPIPMPPVGGFQGIPLNRVVSSAMPIPGTGYGFSFAPLPAQLALPAGPQPAWSLGPGAVGPSPMSASAASVYTAPRALAPAPQLTLPAPMRVAPQAGPGAGGGGSFAGQASYSRPPFVAPTAASSAGGAQRALGAATAAEASGSALGRSAVSIAAPRLMSMEGLAGLGRNVLLPGLGRGVGGYFASQLIPQSQGPLDNIARGVITGAAAGSVAGWPGAVAGGIGGGVIGWLTSSDDDSDDDVQAKVYDRFDRILSQYGASNTFIRQAQNQFRLAWEVQGGDEGLPREEVQAIADDVLGGMIQQWQSTQGGGPRDPFGDARDQLAQAREYDMAQIAAQQAWMQPLMTDILQQQQGYADTYGDIGMAMAQQISDPAVQAAFEQLSASMSNDQATQNAVMLQQMAYTPVAMQQQLDSQYSDIMSDLALQEAQYQNEVLAAGGTLPGATPIVGGIPLAPLPPGGGAAAAPVDWSTGVPTATSSGRTIFAEPQAAAPQAGPPGQPPYSPLPTGGAPAELFNGVVRPPDFRVEEEFPVLGETAPPTASPPTTAPVQAPAGQPAASGPPGSDAAELLPPDPVAFRAQLDQMGGEAIGWYLANRDSLPPQMQTVAETYFARAGVDTSPVSREFPPSGTTPSGFAGQGRGLDVNSRLTGEAPPPPAPEVRRMLQWLPDNPSDGDVQAVYNALVNVFGYSGTDANQLIRDELSGVSGGWNASVAPPVPSDLGPLLQFPGGDSLQSVSPGTAPPGPTGPTPTSYGMYPQQMTDQINRTRLVPG